MKTKGRVRKILSYQLWSENCLMSCIINFLIHLALLKWWN